MKWVEQPAILQEQPSLRLCLTRSLPELEVERVELEANAPTIKECKDGISYLLARVKEARRELEEKR